MSTYTALPTSGDDLINWLDAVWKTSPRIRSDAARFYIYEVAVAACQGLVTTWQGTGYGDRWLITPAGLEKVMSASRKQRRR